jgi:P27 family predicted phage terminase small subunit
MPNPRKSTRLKVVTGTDRAARKPARDPAVRLDKCPSVPATISDDAKPEWKRLAPIAHRLGTLAEADLRAFELLCETLATERQARAEVASAGMTTATADGGLKPHPAVRIMETARAQAAALLANFGLTPRGRQSVNPAPLPSQNDVAEKYLAREFGL